MITITENYDTDIPWPCDVVNSLLESRNSTRRLICIICKYLKLISWKKLKLILKKKRNLYGGLWQLQMCCKRSTRQHVLQLLKLAIKVYHICIHVFSLNPQSQATRYPKPWNCWKVYKCTYIAKTERIPLSKPQTNILVRFQFVILSAKLPTIRAEDCYPSFWLTEMKENKKP